MEFLYHKASLIYDKLYLMNKPKITEVDKSTSEYGVFFWQLPDGHLFHDGTGSFLSVQAWKNDFAAIKSLSDTARHYGKEGRPWFKAGARQVSDMEYSEQVGRLAEGLIPSLNDLGAVADAQESIRENGLD